MSRSGQGGHEVSRGVYGPTLMVNQDHGEIAMGGVRQGLPALALDEAVKTVVNTQSMIDIAAKQLYGLREFRTSEQLIQKEICESESKLIRLFSKILAVKRRLRLNGADTDSLPAELSSSPQIDQWLHIVGITESVAKRLSESLSLQTMLEMPPGDLSSHMTRLRATSDDITRLTTALSNLKLATDHQLNGWKSSDAELHWSTSSQYSGSGSGAKQSTSSSSPSPKFVHSARPSTSSLPGDAMLSIHSPQSPAPHSHGGARGLYNIVGAVGGGDDEDSSSSSQATSPFTCYSSPAAERRHRLTPPATPPVIKSVTSGSTSGVGGKVGKTFPTTPPPQKKNKLYPGDQSASSFQPLTKSKSHESQLANKVNQNDGGLDISKYIKRKPQNLTLGSSEAIMQQCKPDGSQSNLSRAPLSGQSSPLLLPSPFKSPQSHRNERLYDDIDSGAGTLGRTSQLSVPPVSPLNLSGTRTMLHSIHHRFQNKLVMSACDLCRKHIFRGKVCKSCKAKFHRECASKAAPSCGLSEKVVDMILRTMTDNSEAASPDLNGSRYTERSYSSSSAGHSTYHAPDSSSATSSCNSSSPSSPAVGGGVSAHTPSSPLPRQSRRYGSAQAGGGYCGSSNGTTRFQFPEVQPDGDSTLGSSISNTPTVSICTIDVINTTTSNDSDKSDRTLIDSNSADCVSMLDRLDSQDVDDGAQNLNRANSISVTLKEWDIPYDELGVGELIGVGRFGVVHKGSWHGDVAIKLLELDKEKDNKAQLQAFKREVAMLRKTRHENLVLFMGACMTPPRLAIITSLCKGSTLFAYLHQRKEKFTMNRTVIIASQVAQGMGYLHAKGIIHKDLKSKNIFLENVKQENGKVVITDFGLFSVTKLCHGSRKGRWLTIPPGWLCYLAPEIMRSLRAGNQLEVDLPFTEASDVYAFGTVWYELLCGEWPFKQQPPESIVWQVGKGMKQSLTNIQSSRDVKDVLMQCWAFKPGDRVDFRELLKILDRLPKKRLARSPSHPIQLSRSAESVF